jgi:hypothetical protein
MKKLVIVAATVLAMVAVVAAVSTAAGHHSVKTKVTIKSSGGPPATAIKGRVKARRHGHRVKKCIKKRTVVVKHDGSKVGKDKTNKKGKYKVPIDAYSEPGDYKSIARKKHVHHLTCKKGKSKTITVS